LGFSCSIGFVGELEGFNPEEVWVLVWQFQKISKKKKKKKILKDAQEKSNLISFIIRKQLL